jgi:Phage major tail protein.
MAKTKGIDSARLAIFKQNEETIDTSNTTLGTAGVYTLDEKTAQGMTVGNITGLTPTMTKIYGSDMVVETSGKGVGSVQATVGANDIPEDVIDAITGVDNAKGFSVVTSDTRAPYSVIEFITHGRMNNILHFAFTERYFRP